MKTRKPYTFKSFVDRLTKSEKEVIAAIKGSAALPKRLKRHDNAIEKLKIKGVIEKGTDNILRMKVRPSTLKSI